MSKDMGASAKADRAAAATQSNPQAVSSKADIPSAGSMHLLLTMVEFDIGREGETASFMVRAGLLRDIFKFALGQASAIEARSGETHSGSTEGESAPEGDAQ